MLAKDHPIDCECEVFVNLSARDLIVISTALIGAIGNGYLFVAAVHDGHRGLYRAAGVAFFIFSLVAAVFFLRAL